MPLVDTKGLVKRFGDLVAVDGVSLAVDRGEVVGFLGPNGAGKSTTMKIIAGFLNADSGSASICGHDIQTAPLRAQSRLGYLPEGAPAYGDMTTGAFLRFVGRLRGLKSKRLDQRLGLMAEQVNLGAVWNRPIEALSKGFKRRVGIAQALIHDPDVLLLDEPTDGLDPNQKHDMRALIRAIAPEKAIVISTHILEEVEALCSRAVIVAAGRVLADATPLALVEGYSREAPLAATVASGDVDAVRLSAATALGPNGFSVQAKTEQSSEIRLNGAGNEMGPAGLAATLAGVGLEVESVGRARPRLEDVFRDITRQTRA